MTISAPKVRQAVETTTPDGTGRRADGSVRRPSTHEAGAARSRAARIPALDGIRGIAVGLVLLYHFFIYHQTYVARDPHWLQPIVKLFNLGSSMGWVGVEMFFVLSGFLITGILFDAKGGSGYFRSFYGRRAVRILPVYYAVLLFHIVVLSRLVLPTWANLRFVVEHQWWYWTFLTNFLFAEPLGWHRLTSHLWTLAIEEQFYLAWPLIVWWVGRKRLMQACLLLLGAGALLRLGLVLDGVRPDVLYLLTPTELDGLLVGAFLALALKQADVRPFVVRHARTIGAAALAVLVSIVVVRRGLAFADPVVPVIGYTCLAVVFGALTFVGATGSARTVTGSILGNPLLRFLGRYSYAIYLLHMPIIQLWRGPQRAESRLVAGGVPPFFAHLAYMLVVTVVVVAVSLVSWYVLEQPFLRLRSGVKPSARPIGTGA